MHSRYSDIAAHRNYEIETALNFYVVNRSLLPWNGIRDLQKKPILLRNSLAGSNPWCLSAGMLLYCRVAHEDMSLFLIGGSC